MSKIGFVLRHGWSFDASALTTLATKLERFSPHIAIDDCGYWSDAPTLAERSPHINWIAVGHSYGFASLLADRRCRWVAAIGIGAFLRFPSDGIDALYDAVALDPQRAVAAFRRRCRLRAPQPVPATNEFGRARLLHDLHELKMLDFTAPSIPQLLLHGARDLVAPPPSESVMHAQAGHGLGIDETEWCIDRIAPFIRSLCP